MDRVLSAQAFSHNSVFLEIEDIWWWLNHRGSGFEANCVQIRDLYSNFQRQILPKKKLSQTNISKV